MNNLSQGLQPLAAKYIWWMTPEEAGQFPERVVAQVMDIGTFEDVTTLVALVGEDTLRSVLQRAEPGCLSGRSWHYWHYRLGLSRPNEAPPLPRRHVA